MMSPSDLLATPVLNAFQNVALAIIIERQNTLLFSNQCQTKFLLPKSQNEFYDLLTIPSCTSAIILPAKLKQNIWKIVWFSMSLYKFKSSRCSPCNQSTQRRRKVYRCWVSSSPIKRAKHETCKYDVNHHGWEGELKVKNKFTSSNAEKIQWIHLTTDVKFSQDLDVFNALKRRGAAYELANLMSYEKHELLINLLFSERDLRDSKNLPWAICQLPTVRFMQSLPRRLEQDCQWDPMYAWVILFHLRFLFIRLPSSRRCGLAETVGLCFRVDSDRATLGFVLGLVCVCVCFVLLLFCVL